MAVELFPRQAKKKMSERYLCHWRHLPANLAIKTQLATPRKEIPEQQRSPEKIVFLLT